MNKLSLEGGRESTPALPLLLRAKVINEFVSVKKKRDTQKNTQSQHLAAVTILVLQLVMLDSLIIFLAIIFFRTF